MDYSKLDQFEDIGKKLDRWNAMLFGGFDVECELDSVEFETRTESRGIYAIVSLEHLEGFIKEVYFFVMENKEVLDRISNKKFLWEI